MTVRSNMERRLAVERADHLKRELERTIVEWLDTDPEAIRALKRAVREWARAERALRADTSTPAADAPGAIRAWARHLEDGADGLTREASGSQRRVAELHDVVARARRALDSDHDATALDAWADAIVERANERAGAEECVVTAREYRRVADGLRSAVEHGHPPRHAARTDADGTRSPSTASELRRRLSGR